MNQLERAEAGMGVALGDVDSLDVLAAAQAEVSSFTEAIENGRRARDLALGAGNPEPAARIADRLALYEAGRPYREGALDP